MARIFIDGFESGDRDAWDGQDNATVISSSGLDMDGSYCLDILGTTEYVAKDITLTDEIYCSFLYRPTSASADQLVSVSNGTTLLLCLRRPGSTTLTATRGASTALETGTATIANNTTYRIEVYLKLADSGGRFVVKVDGITDIDYTGDTKPDANTQFDEIRLGYHADAMFDQSYAYFDNFIADDAAWIGDTKIQAIVPTAAGNATNWTASAGSNYACVDEKPPSDADYVSINSNDVVDTYTMGDLSGSINNIKCVQVQSRTKSDGSPTPTNLKLAVRRSSTDYVSGDKAVSASEKGLFNIWATDPSTSVAWTESGVNAMEAGIKSAA